MSSLLADLRHGLRSLARSPVFVGLSVLCLGLGIGVNTAAFTIVNGLLIAPLPFADADRLVRVGEVPAGSTLDEGPVSYASFRDWQRAAAGVADLAALRGSDVGWSNGAGSERLDATLVSAELLPLLGVRPLVGRGFGADDDRAGAAPVVMLSETLWRQRFAADPAVVGRSLLVDGTSRVIVGVVPRFTQIAVPGALRTSGLWLPLGPAEEGRARDDRSLMVVAKLAPGVSEQAAAAEFDAIAAALEAQHPDYGGWDVAFAPFALTLSASTWSMFSAGFGASAFVLLIACANAANLTLARALTRRREISVRTALGASRGRIARQLLTESFLMALVAAPLGLWIASAELGLLMRLGPNAGANAVWTLDATVLAFTLGLVILTSVLFGLAPALHAARGAARDALAASGREATPSRGHGRMRDALVVAQVALSLVLLVGASLLARSFLNMLAEDGGVDTARLAALRIETRDVAGAPAAVTARRIEDDAARIEDVVARIEGLAGVEAAAASDYVPLRGGGRRAEALAAGLEGAAVGAVRAAAVGAVPVWYGGITARYFDTLGVPLERGRAFTASEASSRSAVAIVNARMAQRLWRGRDPLGERFRLAGDSPETWFTVVGVAPDLPSWERYWPQPAAYLPLPHAFAGNPMIVLRAAGDPLLAAAAARAAIEDEHPELTVLDVRSMDELHRDAFWRQEMLGWSFAVLGAMAMLLAAAGIYGVLSQLVAQRTREIGVRVALGAAYRDVVTLVVGRGMALVLAGVAIGLVGAFGVTRLIRSQLYGVGAADPSSFGGVALLIAVVGLAASLRPARRAAAANPSRSLREQ